MFMKADLVLVHANELLTMRGFSNKPKIGNEMRDLGIINDGAVAIKGDKIIAVGTTKEVLEDLEKPVNVIDVSGKVVSPGFVDPHVHLVFMGSREDELEMMIEGYTYLDIKKKGGGSFRTIKLTREADFWELVRKTKRILDNMLIHGTTTIEAKTGYEMTLEGEIRQLEVINMLNKLHPIELIPTFLAFGIPPEWEGKEDEFSKEIATKWIPEIAKRNLAEYVDVSCDAGFFNVEQSRRILDSAKRMGMKLKIHADWLTSSGGGKLAVELNAISADHLIHTPLDVIDELAARGIIGVLLPTTPFCYLGKYANAREYIRRGLPVALGTDVSAIDMCESMQMMMSIAAFQMKMTSAEVFSAATINAAHSINRAHEIGSLEVGKKADIIIFDMPNHKFIPFHYGVNLVEKVIKNGRLVVDNGKIIYDETIEV
jgi:imidazolonepropionase